MYNKGVAPIILTTYFEAQNNAKYNLCIVYKELEKQIKALYNVNYTVPFCYV